MASPFVSGPHCEEFHTQGFTIFRGIIPPSLIADLRVTVPAGATAARARAGVNTQRFQPVEQYPVPQQPYQDFLDLAPLREAIQAVLTERHTLSPRSFMGVLIEPRERPYAIAWHRDYLRPHQDAQLRAVVERHLCDLRYFNQSNAALYDDDCLWVVPRSHHGASYPYEDRVAAAAAVALDGADALSAPEAERRCRAYVASMPGAVQVHLGAGDFVLYRQNLWHSACYVPYRLRATLHNHVDTPEFVAFMEDWIWHRPTPPQPAPEAA